MKNPKQRTIILTLTFAAFLTITSGAQDVKPFKAGEVKPYKAQEVKPYKATEVKPYKATEVKPNKTGEVKQDAKDKNTSSASDNKSDLQDFFGLYQYWVPGTSYTVPDYTNNKLVLHNSAGTGVLPGSLKIEANGTYIWNSSWAGKIIKGSWRSTGDTGYPIELMNAQEGKNWKVGKSNEKDVAIIIWDGSTWYNGSKIGGK